MISSPPNNDEPLGRLSLEDVTVRFGQTLALEDVSLKVEPKERLAIIGASGAGKSTLFRTLTRSVALSSGRVVVGGCDLYTLSRKELKLVQRSIGTIYQAYNLIPQLPAGVNAALGEIGSMGTWGTLRTFMAGPDGVLTARVADALERVGLGDKIRSRTVDLSGGQQQRVAVARLLVQQPEMILADEPFAAVDPITTERVMQALLELNEEGATLLVNLHDVEVARRFPRIIALQEGRVVFDDRPERLTDETLARIYAGDRRGSPEAREEVTQRLGEDPVRTLKGRDGVSAH